MAKEKKEKKGWAYSPANVMRELKKVKWPSDKVDIGGLAKVNAELKENKANLDKFKNTSINIKCKEAIADLKELRKEEEKIKELQEFISRFSANA